MSLVKMFLDKLGWQNLKRKKESRKTNNQILCEYIYDVIRYAKGSIFSSLVVFRMTYIGRSQQTLYVTQKAYQITSTYICGADSSRERRVFRFVSNSSQKSSIFSTCCNWDASSLEPQVFELRIFESQMSHKHVRYFLLYQLNMFCFSCEAVVLLEISSMFQGMVESHPNYLQNHHPHQFLPHQHLPHVAIDEGQIVNLYGTSIKINSKFKRQCTWRQCAICSFYSAENDNFKHKSSVINQHEDTHITYIQIIASHKFKPTRLELGSWFCYKFNNPSSPTQTPKGNVGRILTKMSHKDGKIGCQPLKVIKRKTRK